MAKNRVGTRKTPGDGGVAKVSQKTETLRQGVAKKNTQKTEKNTQRSKQRSERVSLSRANREKMLALYTGSALGLREIGRMFGVDATRVTREARKDGLERGEPGEVAARVELEGARRIAEAQTGQTLLSPDAIANAFVAATAQVIERQRGNQRAARAAVETLLERVREQMAKRPALTQVITTLAAAAAKNADIETLKAAHVALDSLEVEAMAKTARQLVASLRDLDGLERVAYGLKDVTQGEVKGKPRVVVVPAKVPLPDDDD